MVFALSGRAALAADDDAGAWLVFAGSGALPGAAEDSRWNYAFDVQARYFEIGSGANQLLLRPSIGLKVDERWSLRAGYARFRTHLRSGPTITEDRPWEQLSWQGAVSDEASLDVRLRLEHRFLSSGDDVGHVARLRLRYTRPLVRAGDTDVVVSLEPFFQLRDTDYGARTGLSQNRIYLGLRWPLGETLSLGTGYLNQRFFPRRRRGSRESPAVRRPADALLAQPIPIRAQGRPAVTGHR